MGAAIRKAPLKISWGARRRAARCSLTSGRGGGLSRTHTGMSGILLIIEATRQVRGACGLRQATNLRASLLTVRMGGMLSAAGTPVLWNDHMR